MSTYHVAFAVSKYSYLQTESRDGVIFRSWYNKDSLEYVEYVSKLGPKLLDHFGEKLGLKYPMPSIDLMVLPGYKTGAMENYGHVMFQARAMLYDQSLLNEVEKNEISRWLAFELAHMWFGNCVTMKWWNDLWLNEALSVYFMQEGVDKIAPGETNDLDQFQLLFTHPSLYGLDGSRFAPILSPHPSTISTADEIDNMFESAKTEGACLVKMIVGFLGEKNFINGLRDYVEEFKFNNTVQDDLFKALQRYAENPIKPQIVLPTKLKTIMDSWTTQPGYPLVTVRRNYQDKSAVAEQSRFFETFTPTDLSDNFNFWLPLTYRDGKNEILLWTNKTEYEFVHGKDAGEPLIMNNDQIGYYRVDYDLDNWELIIQQLREDKTKIGFKDRAKLYDDSYSLLLSDNVEIMPLATWRNLHTTLMDETEYIPWTAAVKNLHHFFELVRNQPNLKKEAENVRKWMLELMLPTFDSLGYSTRKGDRPFHIMLRQRLMHEVCNCDHEECLETMVDHYNAWLNVRDSYKDNPIDPDYRATAYCYGWYDGKDNKERKRFFNRRLFEAKNRVWDYEYARMVSAKKCQNSLSRRKNREAEKQEMELDEELVLSQRLEDVDSADEIFSKELLEEFKKQAPRQTESERINFQARIDKAEHRIKWIGNMTEIIKDVFAI